jgi:uncharacterized lipoprotein YmbA
MKRTLQLAILLSVLAACDLAPSAPSRFYVLSSPPDIVRGGTVEMALGIGPVELPPHLDRSQIVTQTSRHRLKLANLDQWAEPLKDGARRVLTENLSALLGTDRVAEHPWPHSFAIDTQVTVNIVRFDTDASGDSVLIARWNIYSGGGRTLAYSRRSVFRRPVGGPALEATVAAMSANLAELSREVATALRALAK